MMQTAKTRQGDDAGTRASALLRGPVPRRLFPQAKMRPVLVIIADVAIHEAFQMPLVEYDHMIEQFVTTAGHEPFRNAILPRASEAGERVTSTSVLSEPHHGYVLSRVLVMRQSTWCGRQRTQAAALRSYVYPSSA
jgi:hypothetical protein